MVAALLSLKALQTFERFDVPSVSTFSTPPAGGRWSNGNGGRWEERSRDTHTKPIRPSVLPSEEEFKEI